MREGHDAANNDGMKLKMSVVVISRCFYCTKAKFVLNEGIKITN